MNIAYSYKQQKSSETIAAAHSMAQRHAVSLVDYRMGSVVQRQLRDAMNSHTHTVSQNVFQFKSNNTGLPNNLKTGIENLSGHSMDDVKVHYHSSKPAQLNAHAYAQGNQIHVAPGQEKHLPHEAWHVVQQKQGRVRPTMQMKGRVNVNDDKGLEHEADVMGAKAMSMGFVTQRSATGRAHYHYTPVAQLSHVTEIAYQQGTLNWKATNHPGHAFRQQEVGISTTAFLDPQDPEQGDRTAPLPFNVNSIYTNGGLLYRNQNNGQNLTQGHLLNANLGGKAEPFNLFPISAEFNRLHSALVEDQVKFMLLRVHNERTNEGSLLAPAFAPAGLGTGAGRAAQQAAPAALLAQVNAVQPAVALAVNGIFVAVPGGVPPGVAAAVVVQAGDNLAFYADRIINAISLVGGANANDVANAANAIGGAIGGGVNIAIAGAVGAAGLAANAAAAALIINGALAPAVSQPGLAGVLTATPDNISNAFSATPGPAVLAAPAFNWDTVRVYYRVQVDAPGIKGAPGMQPNNFRQERFRCQAAFTTQDGVTPDLNLPHINATVQAPLNLNTELANLGFGPNGAPQGLVIGPAVAPGGGGGGAAQLNAPSQHNIVDGFGNIVGHATLFNHG